MTITRQQVDAWDDEVDAAYKRGLHDGMKQERALWELSKLGQEIEAQPERPWVGLTDEEVNWFGWHGTSIRTIEAKLKEKNT